MTSERAVELVSSPLGLKVLDLISQRQAADLSDDDLNEFLTQLHFYVSRYRGDYEQYVGFLMSRAVALRSLGEWLPQRMARWWYDLDRAQQIWVGQSADAPVEGRLIPDLSRFNLETPKPKYAFWSSTRVPTIVSPWLESPEKQLRGPESIWRITVSTAAHVAEIHSPAAWSALAQKYPSAEAGFTFTPTPQRPASSARLDPDWSRVAQDWDGVHLSVGGWLTAEDVVHKTGAVTTELRGWDMESTVWFRWSFGSVEPA